MTLPSNHAFNSFKLDDVVNIRVRKGRSRSISTTRRHDRIRRAVGAVEQEDAIGGEDRLQGAVVGQITPFSYAQATLKTEVTSDDICVDAIGGGVLDTIKDRFIGQQEVENRSSKNSGVRTNADLVGNSTLQGQDVLNGIRGCTRPCGRASGCAISGVEGSPGCKTKTSL